MIRTHKPEKSLSALIHELDDVFSKWIRRRDTGPDGKIRCFICGKVLTFAEAQNMHFINRDQMRTRYNETNCHSGCEHCNCFDPDHYDNYAYAMVGKYGVMAVGELVAFAQGLQKYTRPELIELIEYYKSENRSRRK